MTDSMYGLTQLSAISLSGENTPTFLQGQVTCDVSALNAPGDFCLGACCDHKGRMVANFWIIRLPTEYLLVLPASVREITITYLQKYAVFSKVNITACEEFYCYANDQAHITSNNPNGKPFAIITLPNQTRALYLYKTPFCETNTPLFF